MYCDEDSEEEDEDNVDVDELLGGGDEVETRRSKRKRWSVESDEEESEGEEEPIPIKASPVYPVGSYMVATYDDELYIVLVEGEEPEKETAGFTLLKYMERKGRNQFVWGTARDTLKTNNRVIVREVDPPIPVSSRLWGLDKDTVKDIESKMRLKWVVYYCFSVLICLFNCPCPVL